MIITVFTSKDLDQQLQYYNYLNVTEMFNLFNSGIQTKRDKINIHFSKSEAVATLKDFKEK